MNMLPKLRRSDINRYAIGGTRICLQWLTGGWVLAPRFAGDELPMLWLEEADLLRAVFPTRSSALRACAAAMAARPAPPARRTTVRLRRQPDGSYLGPSDVTITHTTLLSATGGRRIQRPGWAIRSTQPRWEGYAANLDEAREMIDEVQSGTNR